MLLICLIEIQVGTPQLISRQLCAVILVKMMVERPRCTGNTKPLIPIRIGTYKVLEVVVPHKEGKPPLVARFGGVTLKWNRWVAINEAETIPIWSKRSEVVERLLAQKCELCGGTEKIEVHHIRKLSDLASKGQTSKPEWVKRMAARRRKSLIVCQSCHNAIHSGQDDDAALSK